MPPPMTHRQRKEERDRKKADRLIAMGQNWGEEPFPGRLRTSPRTGRLRPDEAEAVAAINTDGRKESFERLAQEARERDERLREDNAAKFHKRQYRGFMDGVNIDQQGGA